MVTVKKRKGKLFILVDRAEILTGVELFVNTTRFEKMKLEPIQCRKADEGYCIRFEDVEKFVKAELYVKSIQGGISLSLCAQCVWTWRENVHSFLSKDGIWLQFDPKQQIDGLCGLYMEDNYWTLPFYGTDMTKLPLRTQTVLYHKDGRHICYMTKCMKNAFTELCTHNEKVELHCADGCGCISKITGEMMTIGIADCPRESIQACYGGIRERERRKYPEILEYLGWCSWNAFYHDVSAKGLEEKLQEFRDKKLPVKWILIDDGWSQTENKKLASFQEDRKKFPEGLGVFIARVKEEYNVDNVGVWLSYTGYWDGIAKDSTVYREQRQNLRETRAGYIFPSGQGAFDFWNCWYKYLKEQGVDFVKVDTQGVYRNLASGIENVVLDCEKVQEALDALSEIHFGGNLINCMGMGKENAHKRPISGLMRNSGDFFPDMENGFLRHARQNAINSLFFGQLYYTDWDMWWTKHETATQSAVMRAISGGPIYVSDKVGDTQAEELWPLIEADGKIIRCDQPALPTDDCIYQDCEGGILKLWNVCGESSILAVFCFDENGRDVSIRRSDVKMSEPAVGYAFFSKQFFLLEEGETIHLEKDGVEIINFYPIREGKIQVGDLSKYISAGSVNKEEVAVSEINLQMR